MTIFNKDKGCLSVEVQKEYVFYFFEPLKEQIQAQISHHKFNFKNVMLITEGTNEVFYFGKIFFELEPIDKVLFIKIVNKYYEDFKKAPKPEELHF